jgi:hypothetical protein
MTARDLQEAMECFFEVRAGILQYCAGLPREKADALARAEAESWRKAREVAQRDSGVQR